MNGSYPDYLTYRALYHRYYDGRSADELLDLIEPIRRRNIIDLCGGEGQLARSAIERGANFVILVDAEAKMVARELCLRKNIRIMEGSVEETLPLIHQNHLYFDGVVCRQAVNYWLNEKTVQQLLNVIRRGGVFAFNTFNQKPDIAPTVKEYEFNGHRFAEISWLVDDVVHHVQTRDGMPPHTTSFRWIPPGRFRELLDPYFEVEEIRKGKTSLYKCVRK